MKKILGTLALGVAAFVGTTAFDQDGFMYHHVWYTDASYTVVLGEVYDICVNDTYVRTPDAGIPYSPYYQKFAFGRCPGGGAW
ncbi:hypothetical protein FKB34_01710 [Glycocaulis profundi]|nr:hypothetical protein FKB34_01710 [Glycocaulis profundi]